MARRKNRSSNIRFGMTKKEELASNSVFLKWRHGSVGLPIALLRSSLFGVNRQTAEDWDDTTRNTMITPNGIHVSASGPRLDQFDRLVYCSVLQLCWENDVKNTEKGTYLKQAEFSFTVGKALRLLAGRKGHNTTGRANSFLDSLKRLSRVSIYASQELSSKTKSGNTSSSPIEKSVNYSGPLLTIKSIDTKPNCKNIGRRAVVTIRLSPDLGAMFIDGARTELRWDVLQALKRNQLASWLYGFFSTHTSSKIIYFKGSTLSSLMGLKVQNNRAVHPQLVRAFNVLDKTLRSVSAPKSFRSKIVFDEDSMTGNKVYKYSLYISHDLSPCDRTARPATNDKEAAAEEELDVSGSDFDLEEDTEYCDEEWS